MTMTDIRSRVSLDESNHSSVLELLIAMDTTFGHIAYASPLLAPREGC